MRHGSLRLIALAALILLLLVGGQLPGPTAEAQTAVTIGAWNIQWLGSPGQRPSYAQNVAQTPADLADYIKRSGVDVLGLEEITDDDGSPATRTNTILRSALDILNQGAGQQWDHILFPKPGGELTQLAGLAWNRAKVSGAPQAWEIPLDIPEGSSEVWRRRPYAVKLSFGTNRTDVVFVVVHMKSGLTSAECDDECVRCARATEAFLLAAELDEIQAHFGDRDVVVLGDTNVTGRQEPAVRNLTFAGLRDLNAQDVTTHYENNSPLDRIFVPAGQAEFGSSSLRVFAADYLNANHTNAVLSRQQFRRRYSDHFMVTTRVNVMTDDD